MKNLIEKTAKELNITIISIENFGDFLVEVPADTEEILIRKFQSALPNVMVIN